MKETITFFRVALLTAVQLPPAMVRYFSFPQYSDWLTPTRALELNNMKVIICLRLVSDSQTDETAHLVFVYTFVVWCLGVETPLPFT